jgi:hypothetical protein
LGRAGWAGAGRVAREGEVGWAGKKRMDLAHGQKGMESIFPNFKRFYKEQSKLNSNQI